MGHVSDRRDPRRDWLPEKALERVSTARSGM